MTLGYISARHALTRSQVAGKVFRAGDDRDTSRPRMVVANPEYHRKRRAETWDDRKKRKKMMESE